MEGEDGKFRLFDFDSIIPMPPDLKVECSSRGEEGWTILYGTPADREKVLEGLGLSDIPAGEIEKALSERYPEALALGRLYQENIRKYGHATWYSWAVDHWGRKWNASCDFQAESPVSHQNGCLTLSFWTPDEPPLPVVAALSAAYPKCRIRLTYFESTNFIGGGGTAIAGNLLMKEISEKELRQEEIDEGTVAIAAARIQGSSDPSELIGALEDLGRKLLENGSGLTEALPLLDEALTRRRRRDPEDPEIPKLLEDLSRCHDPVQNRAQVQTLLTEAAALRIMASPPSAENLKALYFDCEDLERLLRDAGNGAGADEWKEEGKRVWKKIFPGSGSRPGQA
ncbi:MAG: DUF1281 family ferredoxin-like fold protein [Leptospirales bacterium]